MQMLLSLKNENNILQIKTVLKSVLKFKRVKSSRNHCQALPVDL